MDIPAVVPMTIDFDVQRIILYAFYSVRNFVETLVFLDKKSHVFWGYIPCRSHDLQPLMIAAAHSVWT